MVKRFYVIFFSIGLNCAAIEECPRRSLVYAYSERMIVSMNTLSDIKQAAAKFSLPLKLINAETYPNYYLKLNGVKPFHFPIVYFLKKCQVEHMVPGAESRDEYGKRIREWIK